MGKEGEINYLKQIGPDGIRHAMGKPFSDANCAWYLMGIATIRMLLPPPPARLLDLGCGTGWTSILFAKMGYDVTGVDIAEDMIACANEIKEREAVSNVQFVVSDYEGVGYDDEFDCVVFFDALHHAVDEASAVRMAFKALRAGGKCVTSESGKWHAHAPASLEAVRKYAVTEKDMPPSKIISLGRRAGFRKFRTYSSSTVATAAIYGRMREGTLMKFLKTPLLRHLFGFCALPLRRYLSGYVVMEKRS